MRFSKFRNKRTMLDGIAFDSKKEAARYQELKLLERAGEISELKLQPTFSIEVGGHRICKYRADFAYKQGGADVVEDVKGIKTPTYRLKAKLLKAVHGITILET